MKSEKTSKEMREIIRAVDNWVKKHDYNVCFQGVFAAFDKKSNVIDDRVFIYGDKKTLKIMLDEMNKAVRKNKKDFVDY